ncbi:MAG: hypothetical protein A2Y97_10000 [Nitrospirae bacterium RBG_13_39_12]|nr:MAG: hypothetical protein A2Y97_10000 [Nitrospirae bacterium RBG_13_39_12]
MSSKPKKKPIGKMVIFGICSAVTYGALLMNQGLVTAYFTRGALYALLPIATAFAISYVHGHFTGYFWSVLGIEATRKALRAKSEEIRTYDRERPKPQPRPRV